MSVQFNVSPPAKPVKVPTIKIDTMEERPPCLLLTCFAPNIKLDFEDVHVGTTSSQKVLIQNPSEHNITICVLNLPPLEQGVTLNWYKRLIPSHDTATLEIVWTTLAETSWRHTFKLEDGHRLKKSITVVFKSTAVSKGNQKSKKRKPTIAGRRKTTPFKSTKPKISKLETKENLDPFHETFVLSSNNTFSIKCNDDETQRATYTINSFKPLQENTICINPKEKDGTFTIASNCISKDFSDDSLEVAEVKHTSFVIERSPLVSNNDSRCVFTPDNRRYKSFSPRCSSSIIKPHLLLTSLEKERNTKLKRKSNSIIEISPPKRIQLDDNFEPHNRTCKTSNTSEQFKKLNINPYLLLVDPFLSSTVLHDENWISEQEERFKKWLNCLLIPPSELHSNTEIQTIDAVKLWVECNNKQLEKVPQTKEAISSQYHTNNRLESLRISAKKMYKSFEISNVLDKVHAIVDSKRLSIRTDRNTHANIGLQSEILRILFCYNPLWLRIGFETIYNTTLPLTSNSDVMGLTNFIMQRFFKDPFLLKKHKSLYSPTYVIAIKQFTLKQFLSLIFFLDQAKTNVLIPHDPCLFCKNAPHKKSREILFAFTRELLAGVGDITRFLRHFGYVVQHEQIFIHEFDYSVIHLGSDLLDGVRLTKVMEILLVQKGLIERLRVPAISKLQKIHNVEIVFTALANANFTIVGDIMPKDIVEGHCEKTLSLLWQIIYKFQAPILIKAATTIQSWWRSFPIRVKRCILNRPHKAATKIQNYFKMCLQRCYYIKLKNATMVIQTHVRTLVLRNGFLRKRAAVIILQKQYRSYKIMEAQRAEFLKLKAAALCIQHHFRARKEITFSKMRRAAVAIQQRFRANKLMKIECSNFLCLKYATLILQRRYRAARTMRIVSSEYQSLRSSVILMQHRFRANCAMKLEQTKYLLLKRTTLVVQQRFRANQMRNQCFERYRTLRAATIILQRRFRANRAMKQNRSAFISLKKATLKIQEQFRAKTAMQLERSKYLTLKQATTTIQQRFRANRLCQIYLKKFNDLKSAALVIQRRFRANMAMKLALAAFTLLKKAVIKTQQRFRANKAMRHERSKYLMLKHTSIIIQHRYRANRMRKIVYNEYHNLKTAAVVIQRRFRAQLAMKRDHASFISMKAAVLMVQRTFRAKLERYKFLALKQAAVTVQQRFRANQARKTCYNNYHDVKHSAIVIQRRFRANKDMQHQRSVFVHVRANVLTIQRRFRANCAMKIQTANYQRLKSAAIVIQQRFKANRAMKIERENFLRLQKAVMNIQHRFRAKWEMKHCRRSFQNLKSATVTIQQRFRANKAMQRAHSAYHTLKKSVLILQRRFRANRSTKACRLDYQNMKAAAVIIQERFRANRAMKLQHLKYDTLQQATITIQQRFRAKCAMRVCHKRYNDLKRATITIQQRFRALKTMQNVCLNFISLKQSTVTIQRRYRANKVMQPIYTQYKQLQRAVVVTQQRFRANSSMRKETQKFIAVKKAAVVIQRCFRKYKEIAVERNAFMKYQNSRRNAATRIQALWRGYRTRKSHPQMARIRKNSRRVNSMAQPQQTLGARKEHALQLLRTVNPTLLHIISALDDLDFITRRCKQTCLYLSQLLPDLLFETIKSGNRSLPDMQACAAAAGILINFYKYPPSSKSAWIPQHMENVFTILVNCCDKEDKLFLYLSTLVWLFAHNEEYRSVICSIPNFSLILHKMQTLCLRKQSMVLIQKYKFFSKFLPYGKLPLPSCVPDWGLDYAEHPRLFSNSVHALTCLVDILVDQ